MNPFPDLNQRKGNKRIQVIFQLKNLKMFLMILKLRVSNRKHLVFPNLHKIYLILILNMYRKKDRKLTSIQMFGLKRKHQNINYKIKSIRK